MNVFGGIERTFEEPLVLPNNLFGDQRLRFEPDFDAESARLLALKHYVRGAFHHRAGDCNAGEKSAHPADGSGFQGVAAHTAGIQFDFAIGIGETAAPDGDEGGIIFGGGKSGF